MAWRLVDRVNEGGGSEEKAVAGHGVGNAGARKDGAVEGGEDRDQDGYGDKAGGGGTEDTGHHVGGDTVTSTDLPGAENVKVGCVNKKIGAYDNERSEGQ